MDPQSKNVKDKGRVPTVRKGTGSSICQIFTTPVRSWANLLFHLSLKTVETGIKITFVKTEDCTRATPSAEGKEHIT